MKSKQHCLCNEVLCIWKIGRKPLTQADIEVNQTQRVGRLHAVNVAPSTPPRGRPARMVLRWIQSTLAPDDLTMASYLRRSLVFLNSKSIIHAAGA